MLEARGRTAASRCLGREPRIPCQTLPGNLYEIWSSIRDFIAFFGLGFGVVTIVRGPLIASFYGARHYGSISGVAATFVTGARAAAPAGAGAIYAAGGSYEPVFVVLALALFLAAFSMVSAHRRGRHHMVA